MSTQSQQVAVLLPVGRVVAGDLYEPQTKDQAGNPLVIKSGPNKGQPTVKYYFAVAIPKTGETHWAQTPWGALIWQKGHADWPALIDPQQRCIVYPGFAWKIDDGDDATPNPKAQNKRNCDREGWKGHWIVNLASQYPINIVNADGTQVLADKGLVKRGYYVEVFAKVQGNGQQSNPGVFINHDVVAYRAPGEEIKGQRTDARAVGFGKTALPAGVSAVPTGNAFTPPGVPGAPAPVGLPAGPAGSLPAPAAPGAGVPAAGTVAAPAFAGAPAGIPAGVPGFAPPAQTSPSSGVPAGFPAAPTVVQPHPGFLTPVAAPAAPVAPPAAPAGPVLSPALAAQGHTWAGLQAAGWTLDAARAAGHVVG